MSDASPPRGTGSARDQDRCCTICAAQSRAAFDGLVRWQLRVVESESERAAFAAARGFCSFHMWLLKQIGDALSLSIALAPVVDAWAEHATRLIVEPPERAAACIEAALPRPDACSVCELERATGPDQVRRVVESLGTPDGRQEFLRGPGLCLHHLVAVLHAGPASDAASFLLGDHVRRLQDASRDLHEYAAKRDALRRDLLSENEQVAWHRALFLLAGAKTVRDAGSG